MFHLNFHINAGERFSLHSFRLAFNLRVCSTLFERRKDERANLISEWEAVKIRHDRILMHTPREKKTLFSNSTHTHTRQQKKKETNFFLSVDRCYRMWHFVCIFPYRLFMDIFFFALVAFWYDAAISWGSFVRSMWLYSNLNISLSLALLASTSRSLSLFCSKFEMDRFQKRLRDKCGISKSKIILSWIQYTRLQTNTHSLTDRDLNWRRRCLMHNSRNRIIVK